MWLIKKTDFKMVKLYQIWWWWYDCNGNSDDNDVKDYGDNEINNSWSNDHEVIDHKYDNDVHNDDNNLIKYWVFKLLCIYMWFFRFLPSFCCFFWNL